MILYSSILEGVATGELLYQVPGPSTGAPAAGQPGATMVQIKSLVMANVSNDQNIVPPNGDPMAPTAAYNVWAAIVPANGSVDGSHRILPLVPIKPGDMIAPVPYIGQPFLGPDDAVWAFCAQENAVDVLLDGLVSTKLSNVFS